MPDTDDFFKDILLIAIIVCDAMNLFKPCKFMWVYMDFRNQNADTKKIREI